MDGDSDSIMQRAKEWEVRLKLDNKKLFYLFIINYVPPGTLEIGVWRHNIHLVEVGNIYRELLFIITPEMTYEEFYVKIALLSEE